MLARGARASLFSAALSIMLVAGGLVPGGAAARTLAGAARGYARIEPACGAVRPRQARCMALVRKTVPASEAGRPGVHAFALGAGDAQGAGPTGGLTPAEIASVYGFDGDAGGEGQTIGIVEAYNDPDIEGDLGEFDETYGLAPCTEADGCLTQVSEYGTATLPKADETGWSVETALDVEVAHSTCPNCRILLVEAESPSFTNLEQSEDEAVALGAQEVSNSYGGPEGSMGSVGEAAYNHPGVVITAAAGDEGFDDWQRATAAQRPNAPASLPSVISVGGTSLQLTEGGGRASETVWNGDGPLDANGLGDDATGGGCSVLFAAAPWQRAAAGYAATGCAGARLSADVAVDANPVTGFDIYDSYECGKECERYRQGSNWFTIGGTSLGTPLIAAMYALAGGSRGVPYPALTLYGHLGDGSDLYDVTEGGNGYCDEGGLACGIDTELEELLDCEGTSACNAAPGYDGPSGVGAPRSLALFEPQTPLAAMSPPAGALAGVPATFSGSSSSDPYPDGGIAEYHWSWGDGTAATTGATTTHTFSQAGSYEVTLTVTDDYGVVSAPVTSIVDVASVPPPVSPAGVVPPAPQGGVGSFQDAHPAVPDVRLVALTLQVGRGGTVTVRLSCPHATQRCAGTITLVSLPGSPARSQGLVRLAVGSFRVGEGRRQSLTLHLSARALALLERLGSLRVHALVAAHDPAGTRHTAVALVTLHAPRRS